MASLPRWCDVKQRISDFPANFRNSVQNFSCKECLRGCRNSNRMIVFVVFVAIYVDNMLTTSVVPIIPTYLFEKEHPDAYARLDGRDNSSGINPDPVCAAYATSNITVPENCTIAPAVMKALAQARLDEQSTRVGLLFASKTAVQLIANPIVGILTNKIGYSIPMFSGFVILFVSTLVFAFGSNYWVLLIARAVQGAGSACSSVSGMGLIAEKYQDDAERGNAMAIALSGLALGVLIGPPFGGVMYEYMGKEAPFLFLAAVALLDGALQLYVMRPSKTPEQQEGAGIIQLMKDPYILITAGAITFANMGIGMLEPTLPVYMFENMQAKSAEQGSTFLSASVSYLMGTLIFGPIGLMIGRWLGALIGMVIISIALFTIPLSTQTGHLVAPMFGLGFAIGMVDSSMMPTMGYLVDLRHVSIYGSVYAIADIAFCLGFSLGPAVGGVIVESIGFKWMLWIIAIINMLYAPLLYFLKSPPGNSEKVKLVLNDKCPIKYVTYRQSSFDDDVENQPSPLNEETEVEVEEYNFNTQKTSMNTVRYMHRSIERGTDSSSDSDEESYVQQAVLSADDSGETEGADSEDPVSADESDSESEFRTREMQERS